MQLVYIHGLDSNANAAKGTQLKQFCAEYFPHINVVCPDLNVAPAEAIKRLQAIIADDPDTGLVGSSLGGFYATIVSNLTAKRAVLINPSTNVGESLKRFFPTILPAYLLIMSGTLRLMVGRLPKRRCNG
ncbi:YqiA/YcfP family alpha/beta fold hydrolase [Faucicola atlantae]|uniref:YqiA/YcfP family alpha/beta fold hydrolase n=1 Tax=Faucicola atlantae TaxID=34059 RepID=UPI0025B079DB|nr:YqiA/YcfP family alpha/beta fold hydrolase [Moraxella atlantae]